MTIFVIFYTMSMASNSFHTDLEVLKKRIVELEQMLHDEREEYKDIYMRMKKHTHDTEKTTNNVFSKHSNINGQEFQIYYLNEEVKRLRQENNELRSKLI